MVMLAMDRLEDAIHRFLEPTLKRAGFEFRSMAEKIYPKDGRAYTALFESPAYEFDQRFPDADLPASYGDDWPPPCVDIWISFFHDRDQVSVELEGYSYTEWEKNSPSARDLQYRISRWKTMPEDAVAGLAQALEEIFNIPAERTLN